MAQEDTTPVREQTTTPELTPAQSVIPGQYIVVLKEETRDPTAVAREHARGYGARVLHTYQHALKGYTALIPHAVRKAANSGMFCSLAAERSTKRRQLLA